MDASENETLKRKDFLLNNYMQWNETLKEALVKEHVIGLDQSALIDKKHDNAAKSRILLDRLKFKGRSGDLVKLCKILEDTCPSFKPDWFNRWLADEIKEEMKDQQCELMVSDSVTNEVGTIVHRQFGHGKRLSESEKKTLVLALCLETQKTLNIWKKEIKRTEEDIEYETELNNYKEDVTANVAQGLKDYLEANSERVPARNKTLGRSTSRHFGYPEITQQKPSSTQNLKTATKEMIEMIGASLLSAESLDSERQRVLMRIEVNEKDKKERVQLDQELRNYIEKKSLELADAANDILNKENTYQDLLEELQKLRAENDRLLRNKEKNVEVLLNEVRRVKDKAVTYNVEALELRRKLKLAKADLHDWAEKFEQMEKGGRINHIYKRDERILARALSKRTEQSDAGAEAANYFKEFEEYEKKFLVKRSSNLRKAPDTPRGLPYSETGKPVARGNLSDPADSRLSKSHPVLPAIDGASNKMGTAMENTNLSEPEAKTHRKKRGKRTSSKKPVFR